MIAPTTTPEIDPRPPSTTMARMKIEKENLNWAGLTTPRYEAKNAPEIPPNAAPVPYARSLVWTIRDPGAGGGRLVVAHRDPRPADARVAQVDVHDEHERDQREREPVPRA